MFDPVTSALLRSAPELPGLDSENIPQLLTRHYADLVSARLRGAEGEPADASPWPLERIADTYELIISIHTDNAVRRASAFVAGTAQQILARRQWKSEDVIQRPLIDRDQVSPAIAAALLFLAAEQYADAYEAASFIPQSGSELPYEARILSENIADLARGRLTSIIERAARWRRGERRTADVQERAFAALLEALITSIELLAAAMLALPPPQPSFGRFENARQAIERVLHLSSNSAEQAGLGGELFTVYAGPRHIAALLLSAHDGINEAALTRIPPPQGADQQFWQKWLRHRANDTPFVWPNHREAIAREFHQTGKSAVVVLPTGAGKTTLSSLKIAGVLARKKKVIFLAPTHALVEQLTVDLQKMFPKEILGSVVSSDFDLLMLSSTQLKEIEIMTPERCLAMLSFAPDSFSDVGLLVFDECHLLSPQSGKIRRALDSMLCVLAFNRIVPNADLLFLSAMLKNGKEFAQWIGELTGRDCIDVDLLWKPSRQARGVVIYDNDELAKIRANAQDVQSRLNKLANKTAVGLRSAAKNELFARPLAIWGLQHNWLLERRAHCSFTPLLDSKVKLSGDIKYGPVPRLTPNANEVAADIAVGAAEHGLKTIVFVNTKADSTSTANEIAKQLDRTVAPNDEEQARWDALALELGDLKHSCMNGPAPAVPHNASMLRLERDLAERMFRRPDGANVIVATPTLAQGLNLPAELAILAGDKRAAEAGGREDLEAHEILNAAARAGRAGHLANGVVLLVPEPIIGFSRRKALTQKVVDKLRAVLPENDRCVTISDPLEVVLDRLMEGDTNDRDVRYTINRMSLLQDAEDGDKASSIFDLGRSLAAYAARQAAKEAEFNDKLAALRQAINEGISPETDQVVFALASKSGLPAEVLLRLRTRVLKDAGTLPVSISAWIKWTFDWLKADSEARQLLLHDIARAARGASGRKKAGAVEPEVLDDLLAGVLAWISGKTIAQIEKILGGTPNSTTDTLRVCPRTRELIGTVIPRGLAFIVSIVSYVVTELDLVDQQEDLNREVVEGLSTAVRLGYDTPEKLLFATQNANLLGRVQAHRAWAAKNKA